MVVGMISWFTVVVTLVLAAILETLVLPDLLTPLRPAWLTLVVVYWLMRHPEKVGVTFAASVGLLLDVITGSYFGIHMLSLSILAYFVSLMHQRMNMFPMLQQAAIVFILVGIHLMLVTLLQSQLGGLDTSMDYMWKALTTAVLWPMIVLLTDRLSYLLR